jgi:hypothetical protein
VVIAIAGLALAPAAGAAFTASQFGTRRSHSGPILMGLPFGSARAVARPFCVLVDQSTYEGAEMSNVNTVMITGN